ncbi:galectin-3-binding protein-like [Dysidea avara]|uniref:galectin-3-binding protein-like n=1 Tax=Dysidea avara TaxID=196820 RepID=UPI003325FE05
MLGQKDLVKQFLLAPEPAFQYEGGVRLVDGPYRSEGRLEVFIFDQWYTLCGTTISENAATAVCYQLGYTSSEGASEMYATMFVPVTADVNFIRITDLDCSSGTVCFSHCYEHPTMVKVVTQICTSAAFIYIRCGFNTTIRDITPAGRTPNCTWNGLQ